MGRRPPRRNQPPRFTQSQIQHMEKAFLNAKDAVLDQSFFQKITEEINIASGLAGKKAIQWRQVKMWHEHHAGKVSSPAVTSNGQVILPDISLSNNTPESSSDIHKGEGPPGALELEFEARSYRDGAWYDVATFLEERVNDSGELEARVRYQGFGSEEDEWVNLKKAVRARSIPLESSECCKVAVGDLVLCFWVELSKFSSPFLFRYYSSEFPVLHFYLFQEDGDDAAYFDAHVIEIERKLHDIRGCRCIFLVRYDHDQIEERVHLRRLCRRP